MKKMTNLMKASVRILLMARSRYLFFGVLFYAIILHVFIIFVGLALMKFSEILNFDKDFQVLLFIVALVPVVPPWFSAVALLIEELWIAVGVYKSPETQPDLVRRALEHWSIEFEER